MITVKNILEEVDFSKVTGDTSIEINQIIPLDVDNQRRDVLMWVNTKNIDKLPLIKNGVVICSVFDFFPKNTEGPLLQENCTYLQSENPRVSFYQTLKIIYPTTATPNIAESAKIASDVLLGKNISIGEHVVIEAGCSIGDNVVIGHNTVLKKGTQIHSNVQIGSNNVIGGVGFGYEHRDDGAWELIPHIGNVVIEEGVEIGNCTCIDKAVLGSTILRKNCKIDNLVHIAHGVEIGENALVIAHAMVAGSVHIGKNSWIAPGALIINQVSVGENTTVGLGAVVIKDVADNQTVVGNPARNIQKKQS
jgi:UDP-3-O-[3-hydroxymyristoyl] glucosamine N-acyltransferase